MARSIFAATTHADVLRRRLTGEWRKAIEKRRSPFQTPPSALNLLLALAPSAPPPEILFGAPRARTVRSDPYAHAKRYNRFCPQDCRKFLKLQGLANRNYLSDGSAPGGTAPRCVRASGIDSQGGACQTVLPLVVLRTAVRRRASVDSKRLPVCPHQEFARPSRASWFGERDCSG